MARVRAWTGSRWSDVAVWTGSRWKYYTHYQFGSPAYTYDMNSGPQGWVQVYGGGSESAALNWANIHLYCNDHGSNAYGTSAQLRYRGIGTIKLRPGDTMHLQASLLIQHISGDLGQGGAFGCSINFKLGAGGVDQVMSGTLALGAGWFGWATIDTRSHGSGYLVPGDPNIDPPAEIVISYIEVSNYITTGALGPWGTYRFFCDWINLIDQNGNLLMKLTADRVQNLSVWNGSAWI